MICLFGYWIISLLSRILKSHMEYILSLIIAITFHEFAHAYVADQLGDPTPGLQGRLTLDPRAHLDLYGSLLFLMLLISGSPVVLGWGKPVQFDPFNLRNPRRDSALISLAGPAANLLLTLFASLLLRLFVNTSFISLPLTFLHFVTNFLTSIIIVNVTLAVFNLIPIHPLDGFKIVGGILSPQQAREWYSLEKYGMIFLLFLIFPLFGPAPISLIVSPVIKFFLQFFLPGNSGLV